jgi:AcrR family transcriptional regulator
MKVRTETRREAILEAASQVFREFGFERASMAEIVRRIGGSKSTIYGYYPSKEALFQAVTQAAGERHIQTAFEELAAHDVQGGIEDVLGRFAQKLAGFMCSQDLISTHRMVLAEAGHSDMGELFYEAGPKRGMTQIAAFLTRAMDKGLLRTDDPGVASLQFAALIQTEIQPRWYYKNLPPLTPQQINALADRAVATFLRAYAPETASALPPAAPATQAQPPTKAAAKSRAKKQPSA